MRRKKRMAVGIVSGLVIVVGALLLFLANRGGMPDFSGYEQVTVSSTSFVRGAIPVEFTGDGADKSPQLLLEELSEDAVSVAVIMDDLDVPVVGVYNHWTIWNIPPVESIPEGIPHGETVEELGGAKQGVGYGRHRYRGPKPPFGSHRYRFHVFVLDDMLELDSSAGKAELLAAMEGHILQYGSVTGVYPAK